MNDNTLRVLELSSSGRSSGSITRALSADLMAALEDRYEDVQMTRRDLSAGMPFIDEAWIEANFTADEDRTEMHFKALAFSDELVDELKNADALVIGVPVYNFSISASLKACIDMIARARSTFKYTAEGPVGLLTGKKAYLVVATGGVAVGSPMDFATPYLRHALSFVGITDVEIIAAEGVNSNKDEAMDRARAQIAELIHIATRAA